MTILSLLRHHGYNVERRVSPTGKVLFGPVAAASVVVTTTPVKQHVFHGGDDPVDQIPKTLPNWWLDASIIERDRRAMALHFPYFVEVVGTEDRPTAWVGTVDTGYGVFGVRIQHRADHGLPHVVPAYPKRARRGGQLVESPHTYVSGNLCVAAQEDWDPNTDTTATVVGWIAHWHAAYVEWLFTDTWPMEGYEPHVVA